MIVRAFRIKWQRHGVFGVNEPIGKSPAGLEMFFGDLCAFTCVSYSEALG